MGSAGFWGASAVATGISSNIAGRWDIFRLHWRKESRGTAVETSGLGKKYPAAIARGVIGCMCATRYNCSCQFWLSGLRKMKPTQSAKDDDRSVLLGSICCFCKRPNLIVPPALHDYDLLPGWWQGLKLRSGSHCARCCIYKSNEIPV